MVIHAVASGVIQILRVGQEPDISPVIVTEQNQDVIIHPHPLLVVVLHFFVERPDLRYSGCRLTCDFAENVALICDDLFQQGNRSLLGHRLVSIPAHAHGDNTLEVAHALYAAPPKLLKRFFVRVVVPRAASIPFPLVVCPHHGLVVAGGHHDPVFIRETWIARIVIVKGDREPHCWPEVVAPAAQNQLEYMSIKFLVECSEICFDPPAECRGLVVDEDPAVFYFRLPGGKTPGLDVDFIALHYRCVCPEIPRRDPDLPGDFVDTVDCPPFITSGDDQRPIHSGNGFVDGGDHKRFPLSGQAAAIDFTRGDQRIDQWVLSHCADDHRHSG